MSNLSLRNLLKFRILIIGLVVGSFGFSVIAQGVEDGRPIALVGGMLLDGYEVAPLHHSVVIIEGNRVTAAGTEKDVQVPANAHIIDTSGKTILPGLIDMHAHLELLGHGDYREYYEFLGDLDKLELSRTIAAKQLLRAGVTSVVDLGSTYGMLETRDRINNGEIPGPRITASGPWIARLPVDIVPKEMQLVVSSTSEARAKTIELIERGVDVIKAWEGLTRGDYEAIVEEAHKRGRKVHAHLYDPEKIRFAIDAGVDVLQHMGSAKNAPFDNDLILEIAHKGIPVVQTIAHRIWIYPDTVAFPERLRDPMFESDLPADWYSEFQRSFENFYRNDYFRNVERETRRARIAARQFIEADAVMGVGTDGGSPMNFHTESV